MHDRFIPDPDHSSRHTVTVDAAPREVWPALRGFDLSSSPIVRLLFTLRGMRGTYSMSELERIGFRVLAEIPEQSLALGLIGRPWRLDGGVIPVDNTSKWIDFEESGYAKVSWTFELTPTATGGAEISTETRVLCTDDASRRRFTRYWSLVGPFSGLIRKRMLRRISRQVP